MSGIDEVEVLQMNSAGADKLTIERELAGSLMDKSQQRTLNLHAWLICDDEYRYSLKELVRTDDYLFPFLCYGLTSFFCEVRKILKIFQLDKKKNIR